jgi:hypothetical protein
MLLDAGVFSFAIIPWHTSVSSCEQWLHTWLCRSCTCEQFRGQVDRRGWGPSRESIWTTAPKIGTDVSKKHWTKIHFY